MDDEPHVMLMVEPKGTISFLNQSWTRQATRDRAPASCDSAAVLGRPYLDFVLGKLKPRVADAFARAVSQGPGLESIWLHGECNTETLCRRLTTRISLLAEEGDEGEGFLVHHQLRVVSALADKYALVELSSANWRGDDNLIVQCGCCRRVRVPHTGQWAMCVALLRRSAEDTSHGLCELCAETYYPEPTVGLGSALIQKPMPPSTSMVRPVK